MSNVIGNFGQITFGAGIAILTPYAANGPTNPTPLQLPIAQDLSIDFNGDLTDLLLELTVLDNPTPPSSPISPSP